jgi:hypothetical protein
MEDKFVNDGLNLPTNWMEPKYHDVNPVYGIYMRDHDDDKFFKHNFNTLAKNYYKREFCKDLIKNFDVRMEEIGHTSYSEKEKNEIISGLAVFSINLGEHHNILEKKMSAHMKDKPYEDLTDREMAHMDANIKDVTGVVSNEKREVDLRVSKEQPAIMEEIDPNTMPELFEDEKVNIEPVELTPEDLIKEDRPKDPTRGSILDSVAGFFSNLHRFLETGLVSWWTGLPLDKVQKAYDNNESLSSDSFKKRDIIEANDAIWDDENENENMKKFDEPVM